MMATTPTAYFEGNYYISPIGGGRWRVQPTAGQTFGTVTFGVSGSIFNINPNDINTNGEPTILKRLIADDSGVRNQYVLASVVDAIQYSEPRVVESYSGSSVVTNADGVKYTRLTGYKKYRAASVGVESWRYRNAWAMAALGWQRIPNTTQNIEAGKSNTTRSYFSYNIKYNVKAIVGINASNGLFEKLYVSSTRGSDASYYDAAVDATVNNLNAGVYSFIASNEIKRADGTFAKVVEVYAPKSHQERTTLSMIVRLSNGRIIRASAQVGSTGTISLSNITLGAETRVIRIENGTPVSAPAQFAIGDNGALAYGTESRDVVQTVQSSTQPVRIGYGGQTIFVGGGGSGMPGLNKNNKATMVNSGLTYTKNVGFITALSSKINGAAWMDQTNSGNFKSDKVNASLDIQASGGRIYREPTTFVEMEGASIKQLASTPKIPISPVQKWAIEAADNTESDTKVVLSDLFLEAETSSGIINGWGLVFEEYSENPDAGSTAPATSQHPEPPVNAGTPLSAQCTNPELGCITYDYAPAIR